MEYNHLLVSQLDSQRAYFEGLLHKQAGLLCACAPGMQEQFCLEQVNR